MCKGQCPGTATNGDWRNRSEHCEVWKRLFARLESDLQATGREPLSTTDQRAPLERLFMEKWTRGQIPTIAAARRELSERG
jgi:uncharacterized protein